ncbi:MAG: V-type ATP synthase subunit I [Thermoplasmata archaeon]|nr:V-type ATP synthase subunit I [Thermoplasmata archaeon]TFG69604.1 MAG: V-type ATP synthase subunit I [Methanomassiliicoccus sp.]
MLKPEEMTRAVVVGSIESLDVTIEGLYELGVLHLIDFNEQDEDFKIGQPLEKASDASKKLIKLRSMIRALEIEPHKPREKMPVSEITKTLEQALVTLDLNTSKKAENRQRIQSLIHEKRVEITSLEPFAPLGITIEDFGGYESIISFVGLCTTNPTLAFSSKLRDSEMFTNPRKSDIAIAAFVRTDDRAEAQRILTQHGFQEAKIPQVTGAPRDVIARNKTEIADLEKDLERTEADLDAIRKKFAGLIISSEEHLSIEVLKAETPLKIATTMNSFVIDGWIPSSKVKMLQDSLNQQCCGLAFVETLPSEKGDEPPVKLKNAKPVKPFEFFLDLVSTPKYDEVDPTLILFITFPIFFGFMIGDLGFGLGLMALGAFMRFKLKDSPDLKMLGTIIIVSGLMASLFGLFVFAEAFGVPFHPPEANPDEHSWESVANIPIHPLLDKMHDIKEMLALSLLAGWVHLTAGFILGFVNQYHHNKKHALAKIAWLFLLFGLFIEMMTIAGSATVTSEFINGTILSPVPDMTTTLTGISVSIPAVVLILIGVIGLPLTEGPLAMTEIIGLFTNLVSYTRLAALAVGKGAMALAFNTMLFPLIFESHNIAFIVLGALALFVTQMFFVFFLGALSAGIQAIRLNYVEFFLKFFEGGGTEFSPLRYVRKYSVETK